jgi:hypothetical protein
VGLVLNILGGDLIGFSLLLVDAVVLGVVYELPVLLAFYTWGAVPAAVSCDTAAND